MGSEDIHDIGFTGSRQGPTKFSKVVFENVIAQAAVKVFRHGACYGWDAHAVKEVRRLFPKCWIIAYPGKGASDADEGSRPDRDQESLALSDEVRPEQSHFARNRAIVHESGAVIGCPPTAHHQNRGGTWYTIDQAHKVGKLKIIILPDGIIRSEP